MRYNSIPAGIIAVSNYLGRWPHDFRPPIRANGIMPCTAGAELTW